VVFSSKIYALAFALIAVFNCKAQSLSPSYLLGRWHGVGTNGVHVYYDFMTDSTYREWSSSRTADSNKIWPVKDLDSSYIHVIDENHFYILITMYATEKVIYSRRLQISVPKPPIVVLAPKLPKK